MHAKPMIPIELPNEFHFNNLTDPGHNMTTVTNM